MKERQVYENIPFGAYTEGFRIVMPGNYIPMQMATMLAHEGGHVIDFNNAFRPKLFLKPEDIRKTRISISEARRRWLKELLAQTTIKDHNWHSELIDFIWRTLEIITRDIFDPGIINLNVIHNNEDFRNQTKKRNFAGVSYEGNKTVIELTQRGYELEVPAQYVERAAHTLINRIIDPDKITMVKPPLPSHALAYESVERWFRLGLLPTPRRINNAWEQRLQTA
jgi:hypothetical protein